MDRGKVVQSTELVHLVKCTTQHSSNVGNHSCMHSMNDLLIGMKLIRCHCPQCPVNVHASGKRAGVQF